MASKEKDVDLGKIYSLPIYKVVTYKSYSIIVFINIAKWIVLENKPQLNVFRYLARGHSVGECIKNHNVNDVAIVVTQLEAKHIEETIAKTMYEPKLHLHITNSCNLRCPHCYMKSGRPNLDELTTDEIKSLITEFAARGGSQVSFTGGEPHLRNDLFDLIRYASEKNVSSTIFTNGCLWNQSDIESIKNLKIDGVQISIDGYDEKSNAVFRGDGSFEKALNAISLFINNGIKVSVAITPPYSELKSNPDGYISLAKRLISQYKENIAIDFSHSFMEGRDLSQHFINQISKEYGRLIDRVVFKVFGRTEESTFVKTLEGDYIYDSCGYGGLNVMSNGDIYFCDRIPDAAKITNIRDIKFKELFHFMEIAGEKGLISNFRPCRSCDLKYICGGGCRAEHFRNFTKLSNLTNVDFRSIPSRKCDYKIKNRFYNLMIKTNHYFYD